MTEGIMQCMHRLAHRRKLQKQNKRWSNEGGKGVDDD